METQTEPRIDTANMQIVANSTEKAKLASEDINTKFFKNEMTTILIEKLEEPNEYLLTFAKSMKEAEEAREHFFEEYYQD